MTYYFSEDGVRHKGDGEWDVFYSKEEIEKALGKPYIECRLEDINIFALKREFEDKPDILASLLGIHAETSWMVKVKHYLGLEKTKVYDLGYDDLTQDQYFQQLKEWDILLLIDVRWTARGKKGFNGGDLAERCYKEGIDYIRARELGNPFKDNPNWKKRWEEERLAREYSWSYDYTFRLSKVAKLVKMFDVCLLCKEKRIEDCHRQFVKGDLQKIKEGD